MNPVRTGRVILALMPYALFMGGVLAAAKLAGAPGGAPAALQALGIAGMGLVWGAVRHRRRQQ